MPRGLWDNIHAKRKRIKAGSGEKMRKPGTKGAPTAKALKRSQTKKRKQKKKVEGLSPQPLFQITIVFVVVFFVCAIHIEKNVTFKRCIILFEIIAEFTHAVVADI